MPAELAWEPGRFLGLYTCMALRYSVPPDSGPPPLFLDENALMKICMALMAVVVLGGCATVSDTYLNNGEQGLTIDCSGEANSWAACYEKASESCAGAQYEIRGTDGTPAPKESEKTLGVDVGNYKSRSVVVVCK